MTKTNSTIRYYTHDFGNGGESAGKWCYLIMESNPYNGSNFDSPITWVDWWLLDVESYTEEGWPIFLDLDNHGSRLLRPHVDPSNFISTSEKIAEGFFKWDGCAEVTADIHTCSKSEWHSVLEIISSIRQICVDQYGIPKKE